MADEEVDGAAAGLRAVEEDLGVGDGAGMVVRGHGQFQRPRRLGGEGPVPPAEGLVPYDGPSPGRIRPPRAAPRPSSGRPVSNSLRNPPSCAAMPRGRPGAGAPVRERAAGEQAAAQIDEAEGGERHSDVQPGRDRPADGSGVQVERDPRPADAGAPCRRSPPGRVVP
ncbi:hypothetical protein ACFWUZ_10240 [Streptomyces sp. NPDC058646]|uniref:hypothetical protein n=1 Tax=Streptomyces sp. NPDC058646 TaxID=3346574 RepID=UPI00364BE725